MARAKYATYGICKDVSNMCKACCKHAANMLEYGMNALFAPTEWGMPVATILLGSSFLLSPGFLTGY
jgi:hypothetical protein